MSTRQQAVPTRLVTQVKAESHQKATLLHIRQISTDSDSEDSAADFDNMSKVIRWHLMQGLGNPLGEAVLVIWELLHARPCLHVGCAQQAEDLEDLINFLHMPTAQR